MAKNKKVVAIIVAVSLILGAIIAYRIYANIAANKERAGRVSQGRVVTVEAGKVTRQDLRPVHSFSASLEPIWSADISPKVDGRIDRLNVEEGDTVQAGTILAVLDTNELAAQVNQAEGSVFAARANLEQAELDFKRTAALAQQGAVSAQTLDTARIKRDLALGQLRSAEGNLALLSARLQSAAIEAPRAGVVAKRYLQAGFYAKAGSPVVSLADVTSLLAKATVGEAQIGEISVGIPAKVTVAALGNKEFAGSVTRVSPAAALPSRTFIAEVVVPNAGGIIKAGMFARVEIAGAVRKNVLVVPESALVLREDQKTVYVITNDNKAQQRVLKLGYVGQGVAEVLEGLQEGERIVVSGQNKLKDGASLRIAGPGEAADR
ncbi:MAG: efflux RND transporter periplasmic adaptor subunit [Negativicutes bacterium]|nr:efflux RND transporter periplasmic adaptor subunit [Negativicutes bacterium]